MRGSDYLALINSTRIFKPPTFARFARARESRRQSKHRGQFTTNRRTILQSDLRTNVRIGTAVNNDLPRVTLEKEEESEGRNDSCEKFERRERTTERNIEDVNRSSARGKRPYQSALSSRIKLVHDDDRGAF